MAVAVEVEFTDSTFLTSALDALPIRKVSALAKLLQVTTRSIQSWKSGAFQIRASTKKLLIHEIKALPGDRLFVKGADGEIVYILDKHNFLSFKNDYVATMSILEIKIPRPVVLKVLINPEFNKDVIEVLRTWRGPFDI